MRHISEAVKGFIKKAGLSGRQEEIFLYENWKSIAGAEMAETAEPFRMDKGKLFIQVENSVMMNEVTYKKKALKDKINRMFKKTLVREIIVKIRQK